MRAPPIGPSRSATSSGFCAFEQAAVPPELVMPVPVIGKGVRQGAAPIQAVQWAYQSPEFGSFPDGKQAQDRVQNVAGVPHIVDGARRAGTSRSSWVQGPRSRGLEELSKPAQSRVGGPWVEWIILAQQFGTVHRENGAQRQATDMSGQFTGDGTLDRLQGAQGAGPLTRHQPFDVRSCRSSCHPFESLHRGNLPAWETHPSR